MVWGETREISGKSSGGREGREGESKGGKLGGFGGFGCLSYESRLGPAPHLAQDANPPSITSRGAENKWAVLLVLEGFSGSSF